MDSFKLFQTHNLKFQLSFSLFCVLFTLLPLLSQSFKPFVGKFSSSYYTFDKSYMFLLCNILLAFIALYSSLFNPTSSTTHQSIQHVLGNEKSNWYQFYIAESNITEPIDGDNVMESESEEDEKEEEKSLIPVEQENVIIETEEEEEEEEEGNVHMIIDEDETEKLNKKCEDFIKKMKATFYYDSRAENMCYFDYDQNQRSLVLIN